MAGELKLPLKTFRFRVKDKTSGKRLDGRDGQLCMESLGLLSYGCNRAARAKARQITTN
jgi:hypothetical protein